MSYFCLSDSVLTDNQRCKFYFEQVFLTQSVRQNCVESVQIGKNTSYLSVFSINAGKSGPEKLRIRTIFMQCLLLTFHVQLITVPIQKQRNFIL